MPTIAAQAGTTDQVIDLHAEAWTEPRSPGSGQTDHGAVCCPGCARFDQWVYRLGGGYASTRFIALCNEARDVAGPGGQFRYLNLAQEVDEEHTAGAGSWLADEAKLANTESVRIPEQRRGCRSRGPAAGDRGQARDGRAESQPVRRESAEQQRRDIPSRRGRRRRIAGRDGPGEPGADPVRSVASPGQ